MFIFVLNIGLPIMKKLYLYFFLILVCLGPFIKKKETDCQSLQFIYRIHILHALLRKS